MGGKNLVSSLILARLAQIWAPKTFFVDFTSTTKCLRFSSYYFMQFKGKVMNQTWENGKKI